MRKAEKQVLLDTVKTIYEAHDAVRKYLKKNENENAQNMLGECQNTAIQIGGLIEEIEGEDCITVRYLEEYCDLLFEIHSEISDGFNGSRAYKLLNNKLTEIEDSLKNDIPLRKEVVFLPYKASMWDSLEGAWKEAEADENCDAYVIPIPYFDRNEDQTFGEMHYEGDQYPDYVPITSWQAYNFEERRPDEIYFHNPYDEYNSVTSVHPAFYSKNLKKYTDMLVYIPYFVVLNDNIPAHFCTLAGVIYADKVIVQSDKVKQTYITELSKFLKENGFKNADQIVKNKFVVKKNSKVEKAENSKLEDFEIPTEWEKLIVREDGSRKKVIFYNTTIVTLLEKSDDILKKIKDVLKIFEREEDVVLLWRPHPLLRTTITSMRAELGEEYDRIVDEYKKAGWGIFDDTADMHRSIALSDAYYGDWSSVVEVYKGTGKPIMIQNVDLREEY